MRENEKAWRWYEREGFVFEKEAVEPMTGFVMKYYRWKMMGPRANNFALRTRPARSSFKFARYPASN